MLIQNEKSFEEFQSFGKKDPEEPMKQIRALSLIWALIMVLIRHGNIEIYYHLCGSYAKDSWDCPMEAEGIAVRMTNTGKKLTIW